MCGVIMTEGIGSYRVVGRPERDIPEDSIFPMDTPEQRKRYFERLSRFKTMNAGHPVYRLAPGEPRVKRFRTLEEANADWETCATRAVSYRREHEWRST